MSQPLNQDEKQRYDSFLERKEQCEENAVIMENIILKAIKKKENNNEELDQNIFQTQFLRDIYYYGIDPSYDVEDYAYSLDDRSLQSWNQFKRLYAMIRQYNDGKEVFNTYFESDELIITAIDDNGNKTELNDLLEIIQDIDAYQLDFGQAKHIIDLYNDDTRRIGILLEAEKIDEIIAERNKPKEYLCESELGSFV